MAIITGSRSNDMAGGFAGGGGIIMTVNTGTRRGLGMIKHGTKPGTGAVALFTTQQRANMVGRLAGAGSHPATVMATCTVCRCTLEHAVNMALITAGAHMSPGKNKTGTHVVKLRTTCTRTFPWLCFFVLILVCSGQ